MTFIGLQVLGSISFYPGNEASAETELKSSENKNVGTKNHDLGNHVNLNLKKLKNDQSNSASKEESIIDKLKGDTKLKPLSSESKDPKLVHIYKEHPEVPLMPIAQGKKSNVIDNI